jgi:hypothetical protein
MRFQRMMIVTIFFMFTFAGRSEAQLGMSWVGSTGVVDSDYEGMARTQGGAVYLKQEISSGRVVLRYNVPPINRLLRESVEGERRWFDVRLADNGLKAQVVVVLIEYNFHSGARRELLRLDSNDFPPTAGFQALTSEARSFDFQFADAGGFGGDSEDRSFYYVEVHLLRSELGGAPGIAGIALISDSP